MGKGGGGGGRKGGREQGGNTATQANSSFEGIYLTKKIYERKIEEMKEYEPNASKKELENLLALKRYTNVDYGHINSYLRTGDEQSLKNAYSLKADKFKQDVSYSDFKKATLNQISAAEKALDNMPNYKGTVIRGTDVNPDNYKVGKTIVEKAFTSTTTNSNYGGSVKFIIQSKTGKNINRISDYKDVENEVLFKPSTSFKVTNKEVVNGRPHIYMTEV